jgi:hypothetical protein
MSFFRSLNRSAATGTAVAAALGLAGIGTALSPLLAPIAAPPGARAQGTPGLVEFRWDNSRDYRRLYFFMTETQRLKRSEYYLILKPKDRNTAILKLSVGIPKSFDVDIDPKNVQLCYMKEGGMLARTRCEKVIPAVVEVSKDSTAVEIFPETPVPVGKTIGVYMNLFNPFNVGMYQFNALAQAPGDVPISGYLGSWLIQIDPPNN